MPSAPMTTARANSTPSAASTAWSVTSLALHANATTGQGSATHLVAEYLSQASGIRLTHVPYKGDNPAANDIIAGHVSMGMLTPIIMVQQVKAGRLRALAVTSSSRFAPLPDVLLHDARRVELPTGRQRVRSHDWPEGLDQCRAMIPVELIEPRQELRGLLRCRHRL